VGAADDRTTADAALRRLRAGEALLYAGDYHNARQLLSALGRRLARAAAPARGTPAEVFRAERRQRLLEHELLSRLLVPVEPDLRLPLPRAPDLSAALGEAWGAPDGRPSLAPLRELLGMVGAHEWRRKGVEVPALGGRVHPHYGVFAPVRGEYVQLVADELGGRDLAGRTAFDVGTGTGVLAILAARRGARVTATDLDARAVACARENAARLGVADRVEVVQADLFPAGRADLVLCNPPWLPERPATALDRAVYDPGGAFLSGFVGGLCDHLAPGGEGLLVISDLAELLGLLPRGSLDEAFGRAGLAVRGTRRTAPVHPRARDAGDPLHAVRSREVTTLYVLAPASGR
jgi:SAM-dependent methyltransferase